MINLEEARETAARQQFAHEVLEKMPPETGFHIDDRDAAEALLSLINMAPQVAKLLRDAYGLEGEPRTRILWRYRFGFTVMMSTTSVIVRVAESTNMITVAVGRLWLGVSKVVCLYLLVIAATVAGFVAGCLTR